MNVFSIGGLIIGISGAAEALIMFIKGNARKHYLWGVLCLAVMVWGFGAYKIGRLSSPADAIFWWRMAYIGVIFIPVFLIHFTYEFLGLKRKWDLMAYYGLGIFFSVINLIDGLFIKNVRLFYGEFYYLSEPTIFYHIFVALFFASVVGSLFLISRKYFSSNGIQRIQIRYIFLALFVGFGGGSFSFLPVYNVNIYPFLNVLISLGILIVAYAVLRYRLMDIRLVVRTMFIYAAVATFTYAIFFFISWTYITLFGGIFTTSGLIIGLFLAPLYITIILGLNRLLIRFSQKYIFSGLSQSQQAFAQLAQKLNQTIELDVIVNLIVDTIIKFMELERAGILLVDEQGPGTHYHIARVIGFNEKNGISMVEDNFLTHYLEQTRAPLVKEEIDYIISGLRDEAQIQSFARLKSYMEKIEAALCLPLIWHDSLYGIVVLGPKVSGEAYTREDLELLNVVVNQAAIGIANARLYKVTQDFNLTLQQKVDEQTKEIREKNEYLEDLLKMKNEFLDVASHQLKTPISIIRGYLSMYLDGTLTGVKARQDAIKKALLGVERLNQTVRDFIEASDLEGEMIRLDLKLTDMVKLVKGIFDEKKFLVKQKDLGFSLVLPKTKELWALVDPVWAMQAVSNLIDNAIYYTNQGKVSVRLSQLDGELRFAVKDSGIGVPKEELARIAEKFFRGKKAVLTRPDGSGLGLYITKKVVENHGGRLEIDSVFGQGSTFGFIIPLNIKKNHEQKKSR